MRKRLSWDKEKMAEMEKKADPYTMNQDHPNPPIEKYRTGDPSTFAEDPHMATPWKTEGRTETGHPAPAREAVVAARKLEDKAIKCITIAQRMLPGASDETLEEQATDLMYLPERSVLGTLQRQSDLAEVISGEEKEAPEKKEEEKEEKKADEVEAKKEEKEEVKKEETTPPEEKKESAKEEKKEEETPPEEKKESAKKEKEEETPPEEKKESAEEKKEEEIPEEEKPEEKKEADLLDSIFDSQTKTGAKKLSGIVKQASTDPLKGLWGAPPDVSKNFK